MIDGKEYVKISEAKNITGLELSTLRKYADTCKVESYKTPTGQRMFNKQSLQNLSNHNRSIKDKTKIIYCRVSTKKQSDDLERQIEFMQSKFPCHTLITDIGSGINWKRKGLKTILEQSMLGNVSEVVVAHRDRLSRFAFELIEFVCMQNGTKIVVLDKEEAHSSEQDLAEDIMSIITVFAAREHGQRKYRIHSENEENKIISNHIPT
jgi:putative resolvase